MTELLLAINGPRWAWTVQRCGRYEYRKCLVHTTNPDHLVASAPSPTNVPPMRIAPLYAAGRPRPSSM